MNELVEQNTERPGEAPVGEQAVKIYNPLDAEPLSFKRALESRSENYDALAMHLRSILVPGRDFGRIHIAKKDKCPRPWECSYETTRGHWSDYMLFASGADKVLGILALRPAYPSEDSYIRAALAGKQINDVIVKCNIVGLDNQVISDGMGACSRDKMKGDLNNTIKRACKRARLDAVLRLPSISALFEDDFLAEVDRAAKKGNATSSRARQVNPQFSTGASLQVWPLKGKLEGQRFDEMEDGALDWILRTFEDKPDIHKSALREREARDSSPSDPPTESTPKPAAPHPDETGLDEWLSQYENSPEA